MSVIQRLCKMILLLFCVSPCLAKADAPAEALFQKCVDAEEKSRSIQGNFSIKKSVGGNSQTLKGAFKLQKPNKARITFKGSDSGDEKILNSDGKKFTNYIVADNEFENSTSDPSGGNIGRAVNLETSVFFNSDILGQMKAQGGGVKIAGTSMVGGVSCKEIRVTGTPPGVVYKIFIGPDFLLRGSTIISGAGGDQTTSESRISDLKLNPAFPGKEFVFALPKGASPIENRIANNTKPSSGTDERDSGLIAAGKTAPDFELTQITGEKIRLSALLKTNRVVLLMFWSKKFEASRDELPELDKMVSELRSKGFEALTINTVEVSKEVQSLFKEMKLTLKAAVSGEKVADRYHVVALPTNYLIGANGKVLASFEGYDDTGILSALGKAGIK